MQSYSILSEKFRRQLKNEIILTFVASLVDPPNSLVVIVVSKGLVVGLQLWFRRD